MTQLIFHSRKLSFFNFQNKFSLCVIIMILFDNFFNISNNMAFIGYIIASYLIGQNTFYIKLFMYNANTLQSNPNESMQKVEIFLSARNLLDMDFFSKSDPYVKVFFKRGPQQPEIYLGKTETIDNNLNPNFQKSFTLEYLFEARQQIRFEVYDEDDGKNDDFIGRISTNLGALAGAKNQTSFLDLISNKKNAKPGKLIVRLQPCSDSNLFYRMKWRARKLMNTDSFFDFWDKSDPYLKFLKIRNDNTFLQAGRTQIIMDNLNPNWQMVEIPGSRLFSQNQQNGRFKVQCWDWEKAGESAHQFIGQAFLQIPQLKQAKLPFQIQLFNRKHKKPGTIILEQFQEMQKPTFVEYLRGGLELNLSIAIDFTGSNGIPTSPSSLHHINPMKPNQYQLAIDAVSRILLNYDSDQRIPALGFGGKPRYQYLSSSQVSHCFPLSGNPEQIEAYGLQHLMQLYNTALTSVQLAGPTYFGPIISQAMRIAKMNADQGSNTYQILLILTDGQIHDMEQTVDLLVNNCHLPLSIIIVGVGQAQFTNMVRLDGDNGLYGSNGKKAGRDIVQFVPFKQVGMNQDLLAQQLLAQLPGQVVQYMGMIGKPPGQPIQVNVDQYLQNQGYNTNPQQMIKQQVTNMFKEANFFG